MADRFVILTYHSVTAEPDPLRPRQCHARAFASQLDVLRRYFRVLTLGEAIERMAEGRLPRRCVCITFDDGYRDNHEVALPLLERAGLRATFFVATGYLDGGVMFNDYVLEAVRARPDGDWQLDDYGLGRVTVDGTAERRRVFAALIGALKYEPPERRAERARSLADDSLQQRLSRLMMDAGQVADLARRGMEIGGHTVTHPILTEVADRQAREEIATGREALQALCGQPVDLFAYPNGKPQRDYADRHAVMVREAGFRAAVATHWGYASRRSPSYELPRIGLRNDSGARFAARLARAFWQRPD